MWVFTVNTRSLLAAASLRSVNAKLTSASIHIYKYIQCLLFVCSFWWLSRPIKYWIKMELQTIQIGIGSNNIRTILNLNFNWIYRPITTRNKNGNGNNRQFSTTANQKNEKSNATATEEKNDNNKSQIYVWIIMREKKCFPCKQREIWNAVVRKREEREKNIYVHTFIYALPSFSHTIALS